MGKAAREDWVLPRREHRGQAIIIQVAGVVDALCHARQHAEGMAVLAVRGIMQAGPDSPAGMAHPGLRGGMPGCLSLQIPSIFMQATAAQAGAVAGAAGAVAGARVVAAAAGAAAGVVAEPFT